MFQLTVPSFGLLFLLIPGLPAITVDHVPLLHARATPTAAKVTLFSDEQESTHSFHLSFRNHLGEPKLCDADHGDLCLEWSNSAKLKVQRGGTNGESRTVHASAPVPMKVCFDLKGSHLYGGPVLNCEYPNENTKFDDLPAVTGIDRGLIALNVMERYWFSSSGLNIKVHPDSPLFVSQSRTQLCLTIKNEFPYPEDVPLILSYQSCIWRKNIRDAMMCFFESYEKPIPPESVIASPIWSTWVEYKKKVTQNKVQDYYNIINSNNLKLSVIAIDDGWEQCYGSFTFDKSTFPSPKALVDQIHANGHLVTLWVHPFLDLKCNSLNEFEPYLLKLRNGTIGHTDWYGSDAITNFFDSQAAKWFEERLLKIQALFGIDSFKLVGGHASYILGMGNEPGLLQFSPNQFTRNFVKTASKFGSLTAIQVGSDSHQYTQGLLSIHESRSVWSAPNWGLPYVLKSILQLSVLGYGAILPDMIGGNSYGAIPSKELYIRWTQLNTFLPIMQFSLGPWHFDKETVEITRKFINLHYSYKERILKEFKDPSHPVINPIWWIAPEDSIALTIDTEFLLGEDLLVAPILTEKAVNRDIYLPRGKWKDLKTGEIIEGGRYIQKYSAPLSVLPYFERISV